jgi:hypothetical protein
MLRSQRCSAHNRRGNPCGRWAITGDTVCPTHGGSIGHVREHAQQRLMAMVHPALDALRKLIDEADSDSVRISAIRDILDRTGLKPALQVQAEQEVTIRVVYEERPTGYLAPHTNGHTGCRSEKELCQ